MGEHTAIEWCDHTFNPWVGCTKVSPACDHCYAESWAKRAGTPELWQGERRRTTPANWRKPWEWHRFAVNEDLRRRVFCASLADVFDNQVPDEWRNDLWSLISITPNLDWLLLTKRPQNIAKMLPATWGDGWQNVWLGTTVENQEEADLRIPHLIHVPARVRFLSVEPMLGSVDISWIKVGLGHRLLSTGIIGWVICGGESGGGCRPMALEWARDLRDQCKGGGVPFFMKQMGGVRKPFPAIPDDLMIREFPQ